MGEIALDLIFDEGPCYFLRVPHICDDWPIASMTFSGAHSKEISTMNSPLDPERWPIKTVGEEIVWRGEADHLREENSHFDHL